MVKQKTYFNWSSGKDAALSFYFLQKDKTFDIDLLLTSVNMHHDRVSMHGLRRSMLNEQVKSIGLPAHIVELPEEPSMDDYSRIMSDCVKQLQHKLYTHCGFGDIFLEDLRAFREQQ